MFHKSSSSKLCYLPLIDKMGVLDKLPWHYRLGLVYIVCHFSCVQLFATLCTVVHQAPLSVGFSRQDHWSAFPLLSPGDLPYSGIGLMSLMSPALVGGFLTTSATWEAHRIQLTIKKKNITQKEHVINGPPVNLISHWSNVISNTFFESFQFLI